MFVDSIDILKSIADEICGSENVMCIDDNSGDMLKLSFSWVESFYYIDPRECVEDIDCIRNIFDMHLNIFRLSIENKYMFNVEKEILINTIKKLKSL